MRRCAKCHRERPEEDFNWKKKNKLRQAYCRECQNAHHKGYYAKNKLPWKLKERERRKRMSALVNELKRLPCADCGGSFPPCVMDFDHRDPKLKKQNVALMVHRNSLEVIMEEIEKCDLVCANCHRLRTHKLSPSSKRQG